MVYDVGLRDTRKYLSIIRLSQIRDCHENDSEESQHSYENNAVQKQPVCPISENESYVRLARRDGNSLVGHVGLNQRSRDAVHKRIPFGIPCVGIVEKCGRSRMRVDMQFHVVEAEVLQCEIGLNTFV